MTFRCLKMEIMGNLQKETHTLFLFISDPPRQADDPVVIVLAGARETTRFYPTLERLVSPFARILRYQGSVAVRMAATAQRQ
ncbi:hypothetical protein PAAG_12188 [Paracoccidioides lutzii Pb01]|uniref:Uncharacterized protein n=1 Tax=Paracoccidioides lutzii (strain ATCC MYA-826 / Pb01) TaxID=502779 RepID=A0A0A2V4W2_PARBA|nr:hypothetical protein PAAG_12188 [Paracoccidioides lutzii Pb01]KGQ01150.1 hypothetical protein PAAG_12188 [Paracoccidioides lutzii Pb01]